MISDCAEIIEKSPNSLLNTVTAANNVDEAQARINVLDEWQLYTMPGAAATGVQAIISYLYHQHEQGDLYIYTLTLP